MYGLVEYINSFSTKIILNAHEFIVWTWKSDYRKQKNNQMRFQKVAFVSSLLLPLFIFRLQMISSAHIILISTDSLHTFRIEIYGKDET